ncbi:MAG TPA: CGNR zinc finger domain-containing protein [Ktedonobacteraceae bacterium]|nr:CGNR zinc finger domain-containing protein [Ktedonobacteraceae bacterium]
MQFDQNGQAHLTPSSSGIDGAMSQMLERVMRAMIDGTWTRLKACRNETCRWAFYDTSKNRSATWCTMAVCGSRLKTRAYRQRHKS